MLTAIRNRRREGSWSQRGAVAMEFVLVLPILILLVFGIFEFGRAFNAKITLTHAAREAVRDYTINQVQADAEAIGVAAAPQLQPDVTVTITDLCVTTTPGDTATATATWPLTFVIPLFGSGTVTIDETATMRCGA